MNRRTKDKVQLTHSIHSYVEGLIPLLDRLALWDEIESMSVGARNGRSSHGQFRLNVQYPTHTGLKCMVVTPSGAQELFIVTKSPDRVRERIRALFPETPAKQRQVEPKKPEPKVEIPLAACGIRAKGKCKICILCKRCANHQSILMACTVCPK